MNAPPQITVRAIVLGALTIAANFYYIVNVGQRLGIGSYVHSQFPMATVHALCAVALYQYGAQGTLAAHGAQPRRVADPVLHALGGRYDSAVGLDDLLDLNCRGTKLLRHGREPVGRDLLLLPSLARLCQCLAPGSRSVWFGLSEGASIPWDGWIGAIGQWLGVSMAW